MYASDSTPSAAKPNRVATRTGCDRRMAAAVPEEISACWGVMPPVGVVMVSSCATISSALWGRSAGCFARQRMISAASAGGTVARC